MAAGTCSGGVVGKVLGIPGLGTSRAVRGSVRHNRVTLLLNTNTKIGAWNWMAPSTPKCSGLCAITL